MTISELFLTLLNRSLAAAWLVLAILLLRPFLRRVSRSVCCALWGLVAFRLLCPFSIQSILSLLPSAEPIPTSLAEIQPSVWDSSVITNQTGGGTVAPAVDTVSSSPVQTVLVVLSVLWLVGVSLFVLYAVISYLQVRRRVWDAVRQEDGVWRCAWIKYPFVLGMFRPRIYVPFSTNESDLPYILAHERAHLARRDHWRKPIAFALLAVFWFQPVLWVAYILLCRDIEFACDERAVRAMGVELESKKLYATALLRSNPIRASMPKLYCPLAFGGLHVKRRVTSVLTYKKPAAVRMLAAVLVCAVVAVCFLTDPKVGADTLIDLPTNSFVSETSVDTSSPELETENTANDLSNEAQTGVQTLTLGETTVTISHVNWKALYEIVSEQFDAQARACFRNFYYTWGRDQEGEWFFVGTNEGDEDGSITLSFFYRESGMLLAPVTIPLPAGETVTYSFGDLDLGDRQDIIGATYGDEVWDVTWVLYSERIRA